MKKRLPILDLQDFWERYAPYWHICITVIACLGYVALWFHNADNAVAQTAVNTADISNVQKVIIQLKQEVHDLHEWYRVDHKK